MADSKILSLAEYKSLVEEKLLVFFESKESEVDSSEEKDLIGILKNYTLRGGKRIRAYLIYLSYLGFGGDEFDKVIDASLSIELLQSFFLIHDDIMDEDDVRRGGVTPHAYYREKYLDVFPSEKLNHFSESLAILCGDLAFAYSNELIARTGNSDVVVELNRVSAKVVFGQKKDMLSNFVDYNEADLLKNHILKTATYTFLGPLRIGAILAGKDIDLDEFSNSLGIAFQLQDDLLDVFGTDEVLGKPVGSDVREGKRTILMLKAISGSSEEDKNYLIGLLNNSDNLDMDKVKEIIISSGAKAYCEELIDSNYSKSLKLLDTLGLSEDSKFELKKIIDFLKNRKY